jgi:hypothetical protein
MQRLTPSDLPSLARFMAEPVSLWSPSPLFLRFQGFGRSRTASAILRFYGYSVSALGILTGAFWGFVEGFIHFGIFAWLYNLLLGGSEAELHH